MIIIQTHSIYEYFCDQTMKKTDEDEYYCIEYNDEF